MIWKQWEVSTIFALYTRSLGPRAQELACQRHCLPRTGTSRWSRTLVRRLNSLIGIATPHFSGRSRTHGRLFGTRDDSWITSWWHTTGRELRSFAKRTKSGLLLPTSCIKACSEVIEPWVITVSMNNRKRSRLIQQNCRMQWNSLEVSLPALSPKILPVQYDKNLAFHCLRRWKMIIQLSLKPHLYISL